ncbi:MAG: MFS transporter [Pseudomonadota bacterium]
MTPTDLPTRTPWGLIFLLWTVGLLAAGQFAKVSLTLGPLAAAYPDAPVAFIVSAVAITGIALGAVAGSVVARIGARRAILIAVALSGVMSLVQALPLSFGLLLVSRAVEGVGHLLLVVALPTMIAALARPADKPLVMGLWGAFFGVAFALLALVTPYLRDIGDVRALFAGHGAALSLLWPVLYQLVPRVMAGGQPIPNLIALHRTLYATPRLYAPAIGHGIYASLFIALVAYLPQALGALWLVPVLPLANLTGTLLSGVIARRIKASHLSVLFFCLAAVLFAAVGATGSPMLALCAFFATGITAGANFAAVPELNDAPAQQARANGAMAQIGNIGTFSGTPLFAMVAGTGLWGLTGLAIAISVGGAVIAGWVYARARMSAVFG